ncbi:MAG: RDD family protein [Alphaproteobacteria bacterium]|nr:RDD family protein [Alphaproteobacteria bacterium]
MSQIPPPPPPNWQQQQQPQQPYPPQSYQQQPYQQQPPYPPQQYGAPYAAAPAAQFGGFWVRFVAYFLDGLIVGIPMWILIAVFAGGTVASLGGTSTEQEQVAAAAAVGGIIFLIFIVAFVGVWLYEALMTSSERGATLGKRALGLRVVKSDGTRLSFGRATGRFFAKAFITGLIPFGIGYIMAGFTDRKRALHDMIADTVVVKV